MRGGIDQHLIAKEGWRIIAVIVFIALGSYLYLTPLLSIISLVILFPVCYILRNPHIDIPAVPLAIVSPANGRLLCIEGSEDPWLFRSAIKMQLSVSIWNVHTLRSPIEGKIMNEWSSDCDVPGYNRRYSYWFQTDEGDDIVMSLLLGKSSPFTRMLIRSGERIGQGEYCGFLYFSGMVEIYMPENARIEAKPGTQLRAGADILGTFVHEEGVTALGK